MKCHAQHSCNGCCDSQKSLSEKFDKTGIGSSEPSHSSVVAVEDVDVQEHSAVGNGSACVRPRVRPAELVEYAINLVSSQLSAC